MNTLWLCLTLIILPAHVARVIDGDTFTLHHVGVPTEEVVRVANIDTPERGEPGFLEAKAFTTAWLAAGPFTFHSCRRPTFGRYSAVISRNGATLADALYAAGLGTR